MPIVRWTCSSETRGWLFFCNYLKAVLDGGHGLPFLAGLLINGLATNVSSFTVDQADQPCQDYYIVKEPEEADLFGLDQFLIEVKKGKKALDKVGV
ncbi:hypothetical protein AgCh_031024 [Apium graveolens]